MSKIPIAKFCHEIYSITQKYAEDNDRQKLETVTEKSHSSKYKRDKVFLDLRSTSVT